MSTKESLLSPSHTFLQPQGKLLINIKTTNRIKQTKFQQKIHNLEIEKIFPEVEEMVLEVDKMEKVNQQATDKNDHTLQNDADR